MNFARLAGAFGAGWDAVGAFNSVGAALAFGAHKLLGGVPGAAGVEPCEEFGPILRRHVMVRMPAAEAGAFRPSVVAEGGHGCTRLDSDFIASKTAQAMSNGSPSSA
jgi:hypothetical protein